MTGHVHHWKHGWIPLDHFAALVHTHGSKSAAIKHLDHSNGLHGSKSIPSPSHVFPPISRSEFSNPNTPRTRAVSQAEFNRLAREGHATLAKMEANSSPTKGLDDPKSWQHVKDEAWKASREPWGGSTIDAHTGKALKGNEDLYALTIRPGSTKSIHLSPTASRAQFDAAMETAKTRWADTLKSEGGHLGVFHDADTNEIDIDPVTVVDNHHDVETIGSYSHSIGGAYHFSDGDGYWPPYVAQSASTKVA